jgi:hypothetical protein
MVEYELLIRLTRTRNKAGWGSVAPFGMEVSYRNLTGKRFLCFADVARRLDKRNGSFHSGAKAGYPPQNGGTRTSTPTQIFRGSPRLVHATEVDRRMRWRLGWSASVREAWWRRDCFTKERAWERTRRWPVKGSLQYDSCTKPRPTSVTTSRAVPGRWIGRPRLYVSRLFFKKALELKRNQPAVQSLSHKILHKTPQTLSNWTRSPGRPPSPLGPAFHTKWALVGPIQPHAVFLFSFQFISYLIRLTSCKKHNKSNKNHKYAKSSLLNSTQLALHCKHNTSHILVKFNCYSCGSIFL